MQQKIKEMQETAKSLYETMSYLTKNGFPKQDNLPSNLNALSDFSKRNPASIIIPKPIKRDAVLSPTDINVRSPPPLMDNDLKPPPPQNNNLKSPPLSTTNSSTPGGKKSTVSPNPKSPVPTNPKSPVPLNIKSPKPSNIMSPPPKVFSPIKILPVFFLLFFLFFFGLFV
jgi:hypothetical protein